MTFAIAIVLLVLRDICISNLLVDHTPIQVTCNIIQLAGPTDSNKSVDKASPSRFGSRQPPVRNTPLHTCHAVSSVTYVFPVVS